MIDKRIAAGILLAGVIALTGTASFAEREPEPQAPRFRAEKVPTSPVTREQIRDRIKTALGNLVRDEVITQAQKDAVLKAMDAKWESFDKCEKAGKPGSKCEKPENRRYKGKKQGVLKDLVKDGTITQEQADAIRKAIKSVYESMKKPDQTR